MNTAKHWSELDWEKYKPEDMFPDYESITGLFHTFWDCVYWIQSEDRWPDYPSITGEYNMLNSGTIIGPNEVLAWQQVSAWSKLHEVPTEKL